MLIGQKYSKILDTTLQALGIHSIILPENPHIDARLSAHADLLAFHFGREELILAPYLKESMAAKELGALGFNLNYLACCQRSAYPHDVQLNACLIGEILITNPKTAANEIVNSLTRRGKRVVPVRQGYTRCSICVVRRNAVITADEGIARALSGSEIDVLLIRPGSIALEGFPHGFIGGAAFMLSQDRIAFTGLLDAHPDKNRIFDFLQQYGVRPVFLTDEPIFDMGGAIPLLEKA